MKYLFAFDLDGTLLHRNNTVSENTARALAAARAAGHVLCVATGRPPRDVRSLLPPLLADIAFVCYNGALIEERGERLFSRTIARADALAVLARAQNAGVGQMFFEIDDVLHANFDLSVVWPDAKTEPEDLAALSFAGAHKIIACGAPPNVARLAEALPAGVTGTVTDGGTICQIAAAGVSKAQGVRFVAERCGIPLRNAVAFGDDANDIEMLSECGTGVAMGNAAPAVRAAADAVAASNEEDGVAAFLRRFLA